jgi:hypothetical protein
VEVDVTISVDGGLEIESVTDTTAGLLPAGTVLIVIVPE